MKHRHTAITPVVPDGSRITTRDLNIPQLLQYFGPIRACALQPLVGIPAIALYRRINVLRAKGITTIEFLRKHYSNVHMLTNSGRNHGYKFLQEHGLYVPEFRALHASKVKPDNQLAHKLAISDVVADFAINLPKHGCEFIRRDELVDMSRPEPFTMTLKQGGKEEQLIPDDIFGIRLPNGKKYCVFLEVETGKKDIFSLNKKSTLSTIFKHYRFLQSKAYEQLGVESAIVCVVGPTDRWVKTVMEYMTSEQVNVFVNGKKQRVRNPFYIQGTRPFLFKQTFIQPSKEQLVVDWVSEPKPDGRHLTPWLRAGHESFDLTK